MPYKVVKQSGSRPWKIINRSTGKTVGSSTSRENAIKSMRARYANERKGNR